MEFIDKVMEQLKRKGFAACGSARRDIAHRIKRMPPVSETACALRIIDECNHLLRKITPAEIDADTNRIEDDYHPPDIKYIEQVLGTVEKGHDVSVGQVDIYVSRPCKIPTCLLDAATMSPEAGRMESAYVALLREVPRLVDELRRFESEHRQMLGTLMDMVRGNPRREALIMHQSITRDHGSRDKVRRELRLRGEFSEG